MGLLERQLMIDAVENSSRGIVSKESDPASSKSTSMTLCLSAEQSQAPFIEVKNSSGGICCYLFHGATMLLTPAEFSDIKRRAAAGKSGQTLSDILREVRAGAGS